MDYHPSTTSRKEQLSSSSRNNNHDPLSSKQSHYRSMDDDDSDIERSIRRQQRIQDSIRQAKEYVQSKRLPKGSLLHDPESSSNNNNSNRQSRSSQQLSSSSSSKRTKSLGPTPGKPLYRKETEDSDDDDEEEVYIVRQSYGYFSIIFSIIQTIILGIMMWQCGIAPLSINPMIGPYPDALNEWGGKNSVLILGDYEWWRLLTPILLHAGVIHLIGNVLVQLETGAFFEKEWGSVRWLIIYLLSAIGSSIGSTIFMPTAISVGSSGAVMGLFGSKLSEYIMRVFEKIHNKQDEVANSVRNEQCCAVTISVLIVMAFSFIPFVDWAAHAFGLLTGFIIGIMIFAFEIHNMIFKIIWFLIGTTITIFGFYYSITYMYTEGNIELIDELRDVCSYYQEHYENYECNCMRDQYAFANNNNQNNNG